MVSLPSTKVFFRTFQSINQLNVTVGRHYPKLPTEKGPATVEEVNEYCARQIILRREVSLTSAEDYYNYGKSICEKEIMVQVMIRRKSSKKTMYVRLPKAEIEKERRVTIMRKGTGNKKVLCRTSQWQATRLSRN